MPGPNISGSRVTEADADRFEICALCDQSVDTFIRVFVKGEPYYWCLPCLKEVMA